jgi:hypothetical protein
MTTRGKNVFTRVNNAIAKLKPGVEFTNTDLNVVAVKAVEANNALNKLAREGRVAKIGTVKRTAGRGRKAVIWKVI